MEERQRWERSRYAVLLGVLALHVAVLTGLLIAAKTRLHTAPAASPIALLILPQNVAPTVPPSPTSSDRRKRVTAAPLPPPPDALNAITPSSTSDVAGPQIDWSQEAHNVAENIARGATAPDETKPSVSNSPFAEPPPHHKGEQIPTEDGRWSVYVSDNCYQRSKEITHITNATNTGAKIQMYCNRRSKVPRGDLFNQLPAYKKYHPDK
jgi:hypothetical protein